MKQYEKLISKLTKKYDIPGMNKDDIKQEILGVFLSSYRTHEEGKASFTHYVIVNIKRKISELLRKNSKDETYIVNEEYDLDRMEMFRSSDNVQKKQETKDFEDKLWKFIATLKHGKTVRYYYLGRMKLERIAEIEGVSGEAIRQRIERTLPKIKENFGEEIEKYLHNLEKT